MPVIRVLGARADRAVILRSKLNAPVLDVGAKILIRILAFSSHCRVTSCAFRGRRNIVKTKPASIHNEDRSIVV